MTATDWIAAVQAIFLAVGAFFAWRTLSLASKERAEARLERQVQPQRELLLDVVRELKDLAAQAEIVVPGVGFFDSSQLASRKLRLQTALAFFSDNELPHTREAADRSNLHQDAARRSIAPAAAELRDALRDLDSRVTRT